MGYQGFGLQRWIYTLKPRKFLGKRSKPDGGGGDLPNQKDINDYYHLESNNLENVRKRKYSIAYKRRLNQRLKHANHNRNLYSLLSLFIAFAIVTLIFLYLNKNLAWF